MQVYEDAHQRLLILGEPGSGKSTLLYLLAQHLLALTETNQAAPLPIIFALSSWAQHRAPLEEWMVEQLVQIYKVPQGVAQQWVQDQQIIPLLDGLDEMEAGARPLCVAAINRYHLEHPHPLVVCSRSSEYEVASHAEPLVLQRAVVVQPLSSIQVATTLLRGGEQLADLYSAYQTNPALQELATTPLLLNLLILTYQGTSIHELSTTQETLQQQVIERYVQRMVDRKGDPARYPLGVTIPWLAVLARQMRARNQTVFAIELLQPNWLPGGQRWLYYLSVGLPYGLLELIAGLSTGQLTVMVAGLIIWLGMGLRAAQKGEGRGEPRAEEARRRGEEEIIQLAQQRQGPWRGDRSELLGNLRGTLLGGLLIGVPLGVLGGLFVGLSLGVLSGLLIGVPLGVLGGLLIALDGFFRYYTLRLWFWRAGLFPFRAIAFLEDECARHLLKRVGSTYQFMHRLLLDFVAESKSP